MAQVIQANLKDNLGIDATPAPITEKYFREVAKPGACVICRSGWYADYPTYGNFMVDLFSKASIDGNNLGRFNDPQFEALIKARPRPRPTTTKRGQLYNAGRGLPAQHQQTATIPLNWYTGDQVYRDSVVNYDQPPLGHDPVAARRPQEVPASSVTDGAGWGGFGHPTAFVVSPIPSRESGRPQRVA